MKKSTLVCFAFFLIGVVLVLMQVWFPTLSVALFTKLLITDAACFAVSFVWAFLVKETRDTKKINDSSLD